MNGRSKPIFRCIRQRQSGEIKHIREVVESERLVVQGAGAIDLEGGCILFACLFGGDQRAAEG
jgi:hypothetical protein